MARCAAVIVLGEIDHRSFVCVVAVAEHGRVAMALFMVVTMPRRAWDVCAPLCCLRDARNRVMDAAASTWRALAWVWTAGLQALVIQPSSGSTSAG